jgi:hypothetical protein
MIIEHKYHKNAFLVMACKKYVPEVNALLNSLDYVGNKADVWLYVYKFPETYLEKLAKTEWTYHLHIRIIPEEEARQYGGESEIVCRKRYWYAAEIGQYYDAICVLDADLVFTRDPWQFFDIAAKTGFIVGTHKEQNKKYDDPHHLVHGKFIYDPTITNDKDLCNCPLFIDAKIHERPLKRSWEIFADGWPNTNFRAPDMDAMNLCFLEAGLYDKIIKLSNHAWLGTNESILKPYTRAVDKNGKLFTENGQEIFCFHGQYYKKKWRECQLGNRHHCAEGYLKASFNSDNMARGSMELLTRIFNKMCFEHKVSIEKINYVHPEQPYEE